MSAINKIRKALATLPSTPYFNGIGSNTVVRYSPRSKGYNLGQAHENQGLTYEEVKTKILRRVEDDAEKTREIEKILSF